MSNRSKLILKITAVVFSFFLIAWMAMAAYVHTHKKDLLENITSQLNDGITGKLTIESMEPALIRGFPGISVSLNNVLLRDSLWSKHKRTLLEAKNVYIAINIFSILGKTPTIQNIEINEGHIYMYTDTSGISNTNLFRNDETATEKKSGGRKKINNIYLSKVRFTYENKMKKKLVRVNIDRFVGNMRYNRGGWNGTASLKGRINDLIFNTSRGSFMKNKYLDAAVDMKYIEKDQQFSIGQQAIRIDNQKIILGGMLKYGPGEPVFSLEIKAPDILFKDAASFLTPRIQSKLNIYKLEKPLDVQASLIGYLKKRGEPRIRVSWKTKNNTLVASGETVTDCSFTGTFTNQVIAGRGFKDENSEISLYKMEGKWSDIPFKADSIIILDLKNPVFSGKFNADFPLVKLNKVFGGHSFNFTTGTVMLNLLYKAPFNKNANGQRYINGTIKIEDAEASYRPRGMNFKKLAATLYFQGQDLFLQNVKVQSGTTMLTMEGEMRNFANLYYTDPKKILLDWKIKSPQINLNEFLVFLGKRKSFKIEPDQSMAQRLEMMLQQASVRMRIHVARLLYKKFDATNVNADITLKEGGIGINNVSLTQGGGSLRVSGDIDQSGSLNRFRVQSNINNINVQKLFYAFENFGQDAITDQNLRGNFFGSTSVTGTMRDNGQIVPGSFNGTVQFDIRNGSILNFEPLQKAGAFAFPNRDFTNITFSNLKNTFDIQGNKVVIRPMRIETSALNVFLEGIYGFSSGTNIALQIPLRNPKKDELLPDDGETGRFTKGVIINVRAVDEGGKIKFKLGRGPLVAF